MTKLDVQEIYWEKHIGKIRRSPSRSRYGKLVGCDTGLRAGTGQREESRPAQEKHGSEKVWANCLLRNALLPGQPGASTRPCLVTGWDKPRKNAALI